MKGNKTEFTMYERKAIKQNSQCTNELIKGNVHEKQSSHEIQRKKKINENTKKQSSHIIRRKMR